jgi:hypothetical protein
VEIAKFIKKLLPRIERSTVSDDLRTTEKELIKIVLPAWSAAETHFKISKPMSDDFKTFQGIFARTFTYNGASKSMTFIGDIEHRLKNLHGNVVYIQSILDTVVDKDIISSGMTVRAAYVIRSAANMSMVSRYLLSLLNYIYTVEAMARNQELYEGLSLSRAEMNYVESNFQRFVKLFAQYAVDPKDFEKTCLNMPEVFVNDKTRDMVASLVGVNDPMESAGLSGFVGSAIYAIRLPIAQWQNDRYEAAKSKKQQLELRLLYLQMQSKQKHDPAIEKEIAVVQDRIDGLEYKLRKTEEDLGI